MSTFQPKGLGFAEYVKMRLLGADSRFRDDGDYVKYIFLVKETVEIKRSRVTFHRKARLHYRDAKITLTEAGRSELERHDIGFKGEEISSRQTINVCIK